MLTEMGGKVYFFTGQGCKGVEIPHPIYDPFRNYAFSEPWYGVHTLELLSTSEEPKE